jgi:N-acyl-D-amino-acid deacylase
VAIVITIRCSTRKAHRRESKTTVIRDALIVDGTEATPFTGDVAIDADKIVSVGKFDGRAARELDAKGRVLSPGFIDVPTHYDPQLCWVGWRRPASSMA